MNQNEILNYLCNSIKYLDDLQKDLEARKRISDFDAQTLTEEQQISECAKRCRKDLEEFNTLLKKYISDHANKTI